MEAGGSSTSGPDSVMEALPISIKPPEDHNKTPLMEQVQDPSLSIIQTENQPKEPSWNDNWVIYPRRRKDSRIDKYYYHKLTNVMCRSLVEVDNYELYGISPKQIRNAKKQNKNQNPTALDCEGKRKVPLKRKKASEIVGNHQQNESINSKTSNQIEVEKFLQEAYENQLNLFNNFDSSEATAREENEEVNKILQEEKRKTRASFDIKGKKIGSSSTQPPNSDNSDDHMLIDVPIGLDFRSF